MNVKFACTLLLLASCTPVTGEAVISVPAPASSGKPNAPLPLATLLVGDEGTCRVRPNGEAHCWGGFPAGFQALVRAELPTQAVFFGTLDSGMPYCVLNRRGKATCQVACDGTTPCPVETFGDVSKLLPVDGGVALVRNDGTMCVVGKKPTHCAAARLFDSSSLDVALGASPVPMQLVDLSNASSDSRELMLPGGVVCSPYPLEEYNEFGCRQYEDPHRVRSWSKSFSLLVNGTVWGPKDSDDWLNPVRPKHARIQGFEKVQSLTATDWLVCGMDPTRKVFCVERARRAAPFGPPGQLRLPRRVPGLECAHQLKSGDSHVCAQSCDDITYCWGRNHLGQLAPLPSERNSNTLNLQGVMQLAAGGQKTCALMTTGKVVCWGESSDLQLGRPILGARYAEPQEVVLPRPATALAGAEDGTCALLDNGRVSCWGWSEGWDDAPDPGQRSPYLVEGVRGATALAVEDDGGCVSDGTQVNCWGSNRFGLRGLGHTEPVPPAASVIPGLGRAIDLDVGHTFGCAVTEGGELYCWGDLPGDDENRPVVATAMKGVSNALDVTATGWGYCARTRDGSGLCTAKAGQPPTVRWPAKVTRIVAPIGATHQGACAVLGGGRVSCWGELAGFDLVTHVEALHAPRSLVIGDGHACALDAQARVVCVGDDSVGQLATGQLLFSTVPVVVP